MLCDLHIAVIFLSEIKQDNGSWAAENSGIRNLVVQVRRFQRGNKVKDILSENQQVMEVF
jgi:hypothetical protein